MEFARTRLLVVDDQPDLARIVRLVLEDIGCYEVRLETRPDHVPAAVRDFRPAAILLDIDMPGKNGAEVAREIWAADDLRDIPVLFFTGLVPPQEGGQRDTAYGSRRFVSKMIKPQQLLETIAQVLAATGETPITCYAGAPDRPADNASLAPAVLLHPPFVPAAEAA